MMTRGEAFDSWKQQFKEKLSAFSPEETAVFLVILLGFSRTAQNLRKNAELVSELAQSGSFSFWGETHALQPDFFAKVNFMDPKWEALAREAMVSLHGQAKENPAALRFATPAEKSQAAQAMLETIRKSVLERIK